MLTDQEAKSAYDRLASSKFQDHDCAVHGEPAVLADSESFAARARKLVTRGFKPKDAAQITLQEITFEIGTIPTPRDARKPTPKTFFAV